MRRGVRFQEIQPARRLLNQARLERLLLKEDFRDFLIKRGVKRVVLDNPQYSELPNVCGCVAQGGQWIVYETDERSQVVAEEAHPSLERAYSALASRLGFDYEPKFDFSEMFELKSEIDVTILLYLVERVQKQLRKIASALSETEAQSAIKNDISFLFAERLLLENLRQMRRNDEILMHVKKLTEKQEAILAEVQANQTQGAFMDEAASGGNGTAPGGGPWRSGRARRSAARKVGKQRRRSTPSR